MNTTFALPNISSQDMDAGKQHWFTVNQTASVIVSSYLDYLTKILGTEHIWNSFTPQDRANWLINPTELPKLVDEVQKALHSW